MRPQFLDGPNGLLFIALYLPPDGGPVADWLLFFPPFAEEMNKSRPMMNWQARQLAASGLGVLVPDLYGTGDSEGDFGSADWISWKADMLYLMDWLLKRGAQLVTFLGLRTGCLLAADCIGELTVEASRHVKQLIYWQPVLDGRRYLIQFLRLRVAAEMMSAKKITVNELRSNLENGQAIEIAGYSLSPDLYKQLEMISVNSLKSPSSKDIHWINVVAGKDTPMVPAVAAGLASLKAMGNPPHYYEVTGEPFWTTQEIALAPELIKKTCSLFDVTGAGNPDNKDNAVDRVEGENWKDKYPDNNLSTDVTFYSTLGNATAETPIRFNCNGSSLVGVIHQVKSNPARGVLLVVGGPQYRVGSHRQFVLLARHLANAGIPVLRFDYSGMGDSEGEFKGFEHISPDIRSAIDTFQQISPGLKEVVIWGLCDAATAACFYAAADSRVVGLVLLNPWVRSEEGVAKALLKYYYFNRLFSHDFWLKILHGKLRIRASLISFIRQLLSALHLYKVSPGNAQSKSDTSGNKRKHLETDNLLARLESGLAAFRGQVLFIYSGRDLTCAEYLEGVNSSASLRNLVKGARFQHRTLLESDHTFSRKVWRDQVATWTREWVTSW